MTSKGTILAVIIGVTILTGIMLVGNYILSADGTAVPPEAWTLAGVGLGGLVGILASTRSTPEAAAPVEVVNTKADPVNVEDSTAKRAAASTGFAVGGPVTPSGYAIGDTVLGRREG